jgi:hypothetical protein
MYFASPPTSSSPVLGLTYAPADEYVEHVQRPRQPSVIGVVSVSNTSLPAHCRGLTHAGTELAPLAAAVAVSVPGALVLPDSCRPVDEAEATLWGLTTYLAEGNNSCDTFVSVTYEPGPPALGSPRAGGNRAAREHDNIAPDSILAVR